jgi:HK97 gp10 family phage protein
MKPRNLKTAAFLKRVAEYFGEQVAKAGKDALRKGAAKMEATAKALCPVDTGRLRDSIHIEETGNKIKVVADATDDKGNYYAKIVEFSPKIQKPFMMPARDQHAKQVRIDVINAIREAARKAWM